MTSALSLPGALSLFAAMAVLAAVPSVSVLAVASRAATSGFAHGVYTTLGIVVADLLFILLAIFGLGMLAEAMGGAFVWVRLAGGLYLVVLGISLWRAGASALKSEGQPAASPGASFMAGLLLTLADQKAILFYLGFFPAFLDLGALAIGDAVAIALIAVFSVGGVKLVYAALASRLGRVVGGTAGARMNMLAACVMMGVGAFVLVGIFS
jgi:threonine/homoserine/homoserine lactone efflux protein